MRLHSTSVGVDRLRAYGQLDPLITRFCVPAAAALLRSVPAGGGALAVCRASPRQTAGRAVALPSPSPAPRAALDRAVAGLLLVVGLLLLAVAAVLWLGHVGCAGCRAVRALVDCRGACDPPYFPGAGEPRRGAPL